ncbi:MAG TPA: DUF1015 domain-containing protein [Solirubrobacterales bacterium]
MAEVLPLKALRYDLDAVGSLQDVVAPPYDVIDPAMRAELLARSPYNAVAIDLPKPYGETGPQAGGDGDPYAAAAHAIEAWKQAGALVQEPGDTIWAMEQEYVGPDGAAHTRHGILARVRVEDFATGQVLPHERTLPGPKQDRLELMRATRCNLSPIFSLATRDPWPLIQRQTEVTDPWGEATDAAGTVTRLWRVDEPGVHMAIEELLADAQLLIADGHHRYETAIAYRDEVGSEGAHNYTLMAITGLDDPGLSIYPTHRLLSGVAADPERQRRIGEGLRATFDIEEVPLERIDPLGAEGAGVFGLYDSHHKQAYRLRLKDAAVAELDRELEGMPEAYRRLDAAILETVVLKGIAGLSEDDILAKRGIGYAKSVEDSLRLIDDGTYDIAFVLRPIPVDQTKAICESDANMPPKSTYFYPKVPTGLVFNPLA